MRTVTRPSPQRGRRAPAAAHAGAAHLDGRCGRRRRCRRGCRSNGRRGATTRTSGRCPATTRSWRTWPRRPTSCVKNRSGNVHDGKAGLPFLRALWPQLVGLRTGGARLRFRMDGAFFRQDVLRWLQGRGVGYAIKVPFYRWLDLQRYIRDSPTVPVAPGVTGFAVPGAETPWHIPVTVTIYRKKVHHRATKNYQLDLFDPNDGQTNTRRSRVTSRTVRNGGTSPVEDHRAAQDRAGLPQRPDPDLRRQQCVAAARGARSQPVDELPTRDGRPAAAPHPEAHRRAPAAERADAPLRTVSSGSPCWSAPVARRGCG